MKLGLLLWATGALAGPCKPSRPGTSSGYVVPGSLTTLPDTSSTSRAGSESDQSTGSDTIPGAISTGSFIGEQSTSSLSVLLPSTSQAGQPGNTETGVPGTGVVGTETGGVPATQPLGAGTESLGQDTQPVATQTGDVPGTVPSGSDTASVTGTIGDQTSVGAPSGTQTDGDPGIVPSGSELSGSQTVGVPGTIGGDQTSIVGVPSGTQTVDVPGTQTADVPGTIDDQTSAVDVPTGSHSQGTVPDSGASTGTSEATGTSPSDNTGATTVPGADSTETASGAVPSEVTSGEVSGSAPVSQTGSNTDLTGGPIPTGTETRSPADTASTGAEPANTETGSATNPAGVQTSAISGGIETNSNTQNVPATSGPSEGSQPGVTGSDTTLPATETTAPGNSQPIESQSPSGSDVKTETNATEQPQVTASATSDITNIGSVPASETTTKPDGAVTDSLPVSTGATDLPASTEAPSVTSTQSGSSTPVVTQVPDGWAPTCVSGHPEWTANTWITTTMEGSTSPTVVPVLVDTKDCGDDGSGLVLFGFPPVIGTIFNLPNAPKFSFPCIPPGCSTPPKTEPAGAGEGEDGEDESSKSSKTSMTCTETSTVSNCLVECTTRTGINDTVITPECTTTCSQTATGCSVTGTTSTTEVDACAATSNDWDAQGCGCTGELDSDLQTRSDVAEEMGASGLQRRWAGPEKNVEQMVGFCSAGQQGKLGTTFYFPSYPEGGDIMKVEKDLASDKVRSPLKDIVRWFYRVTSACRPVLKGPTNDVATRNTMQNVGTIDHVFEKSFLRDYWREITRGRNVPSITGAASAPQHVVTVISCDDLKFYGGPGMTLVKNVYEQYPGAQNYPRDPLQPLKPKFLGDFAGMDEYTNKAKGLTTSPFEIRKAMNNVPNIGPTTDIWGALSIIEQRINIVEQLKIGVQLLSLPDLQDIMVRQNTRIYKALQDIDNKAKCRGDKAVKDGKWSFADRYKDLMLQRFDGSVQDYSMNPAIAAAYRQLFPQIRKDMDAARDLGKVMPEGNEQKRAVAKFLNLKSVWEKIKEEFGSGPSNFRPPSIPVPDWQWETVTKRDGDSCNIQEPTTPGTTLSTVVSTSKTEQQTSDTSPTPTNSAGLCASDEDCNSQDCNEDERPICGNGLLLPGMPKMCSCVAKTVTTARQTTTSAQEPPSTTSGLGVTICKSNDDCKDFACDEGTNPICGSGTQLFPGILPFCHCVKPAPPKPSTTTAEPPKETDPNANVPEVECSTHADCDKWQGVCPRGNKYCTATDWEVVNGVPTSHRAICKC